MESKMQNRNRKAECDVCNKLLRSDNLKRHKQTHRDLLSLPDNEFKNELESRQEIKKKREEKIQNIEEIAKEKNNLAGGGDIGVADYAITPKNRANYAITPKNRPDYAITPKRQKIEPITPLRQKIGLITPLRQKIGLITPLRQKFRLLTL